VLWNTWYMDQALGYLRTSGLTITDEISLGSGG
jgi:TnpA family transposase